MKSLGTLINICILVNCIFFHILVSLCFLFYFLYIFFYLKLSFLELMFYYIPRTIKFFPSFFSPPFYFYHILYFGVFYMRCFTSCCKNENVIKKVCH